MNSNVTVNAGSVRHVNVKKLSMIAMLCAIAYVVMVVGRIPVVQFLSYDPKDVILIIGGFLFGPLVAFLISMVVSLVEMVTVSDTGFVGLLMNVISSCAIACTASFIYSKKRTPAGAILGLLSGVTLMVILMLIWNYFITPIYMGYPRAAVAKMLVPVFLPFNLLKGGLNMAITLLLYKPIITALQQAKLITLSDQKTGASTKMGTILLALLLLATCILGVLVLGGKI